MTYLPGTLPTVDSSTWEISFPFLSEESGEEFNEVWVYMSFREICKSHACICHIYVSDQSDFFVNVGNSEQ